MPDPFTIPTLPEMAQDIPLDPQPHRTRWAERVLLWGAAMVVGVLAGWCVGTSIFWR